MKIYKTEPETLIRIQIYRQREAREYLTLHETTAKEVEAMCKELITKQNISPFEKGFVTSINIRDCIGGKNGKQKSISFRGLPAKETLNIIINHVNKLNNESN